MHGEELPRAEILQAIGLTPEHADRALPPQLVGTGLTQLIVPLRDLDALARARPDWAAVEPLLAAHGATRALRRRLRPRGRARPHALVRERRRRRGPGDRLRRRPALRLPRRSRRHRRA